MKKLETKIWPKIILFAQPAISTGCVGVLICFGMAIAVVNWGEQFLPLDYEGKITYGAATIVGLTVVGGASLSALIAGIPTLIGWRHLSRAWKASGLMPALLMLFVWLWLITFTGM